MVEAIHKNIMVQNRKFKNIKYERKRGTKIGGRARTLVKIDRTRGKK